MADSRRQVEVVYQGVIPASSDVGGGLSPCGSRTEANREFIQAFDGAIRRLEQLGRKGEWTPVMRAGEQRVADRARLVALSDQIADRGEVLEALRHLLAHRILQVLRMEPVANEGLSGCPFALRNLVLVVREDVVDAAGVNVEALAQVLHAHGGALDVPAWPPNA